MAARGVAPPEAPRYSFNGTTLARDEHGNALGGARLPPVDVPVAEYASTTCRLAGVTRPFTDAELHELYPTHGEYYARVREHADASVAAGFLLEEDARDLLGRACAAANRWPQPAQSCPGAPKR